MNWKKLLCAGLSGALLTGALAGCGTTDSQPSATPAADDIAYQATGLPRDTVLFTVDGREVTTDQYLYWLLTSISTAKNAGYLADDSAWEEEIEGTPPPTTSSRMPRISASCTPRWPTTPKRRGPPSPRSSGPRPRSSWSRWAVCMRCTTA